MNKQKGKKKRRKAINRKIMKRKTEQQNVVVQIRSKENIDIIMYN